MRVNQFSDRGSSWLGTESRCFSDAFLYIKDLELDVNLIYTVFHTDVEQHGEEDRFVRTYRIAFSTGRAATLGELLGRKDQSPLRALHFVNALFLQKTFHSVHVQSLAHQLFSLQLEHLCDTAEEMSNRPTNDSIIN